MNVGTLYAGALDVRVLIVVLSIVESYKAYKVPTFIHTYAQTAEKIKHKLIRWHFQTDDGVDTETFLK